MKIIYVIIIALLSTGIVYAQSPILSNTDNPLTFCGNNACGGISRAEWKWDCTIQCAKAGDVFPNMSETDCSGKKMKIYDLMANGRPTMIIWEGWNCGNCKIGAPKISDYIIKNKDKMNFWFAFGGIGGGGTCGTASDNKSIAKWMKDYPGFESVNHSFLDNDNTYIYAVHSLPHYTLIDANTKKIVMITHNNESNDPWGRIEKAANSAIITGISEGMDLESAYIFPNPAENVLNIALGNQARQTCQIISSQGTIVKSYDLTGLNNTIELDITSISTGLYSVVIDGKLIQKIVKK